METKKSFRYLWTTLALAILSSPLSIPSPAEALPPGVPGDRCGTISNPKLGTLCYTVTAGGGKVNAGGNARDFSTIIQATEREYVIADVVTELTSDAGDRSLPTVNQLSIGGEASVVSVAREKLRELRQIKGELKAKATALAGPALIEAEAKISALQEEERIYENVVTTTTAAGQDAGKFQVTASAKSRKCGWANLDTCGSWVEYNIYVVKRYVGDPIVAYNRAFAVAEDAQNTITRLVASRQQLPNPPQRLLFGAIARSDSTRKHGFAYGFDNQQAAENGAIRECGSSDCNSSWFRNTFGALAEAEDNAWASSWGNTREEAEQNSLQSCQRNSSQPTTCRIILVIDSKVGLILQR